MELRRPAAGTGKPDLNDINRLATEPRSDVEGSGQPTRGTFVGHPIAPASPQPSSLLATIGGAITRWWSGNRKPTEEQRQSMVESRLKYFEQNIKPTPPPKILPPDYRSTFIGSTFAERHITRQAARQDQQKPATVLPPPPAARKESTASQQRAAAALRRQAAAASSQDSSLLGIEETKSTDTPNDLS